jgi:hypothetical protein
LARRIYNLAQWWHLLSLDAPTVAALWSWFFVRAMHLHWSLPQALLLPLGTWLLYVSDRVLDGLRQSQPALLRERHHFHARHRTAFLWAASLLGVLLLWSVRTYMRPEALREDSYIGVFALLYLFAVHRGASRLPKELAVAVLFAAATAVPAWSRLSQSSALGSAGGGSGKVQLAPAIIFFALLCWINCVGIEKWEGGVLHATTRWAGLHLRLIVTMTALFSLAAALLAPSPGLEAVYLAATVSSGLLFVLDTRSFHLSPLHLRIAADAALLTPLALFPFAR